MIPEGSCTDKLACGCGNLGWDFAEIAVRRAPLFHAGGSVSQLDLVGLSLSTLE